VEVPLQRLAGQAAPDAAQRGTPVHADTGAWHVGHRVKQMSSTDGHVDERYARRLERARYALDPRQPEAAVSRLVEQAGPRVEELKCGGPRSDLSPKVGDGRVRKLVEQALQYRRATTRQTAKRGELLRALALHQVRSQGQGRSGEPDDWHE